MSDAQKSDRSKKIRRGFSKQVKKTAELKKGLAGIGSDGVWTYTPNTSDKAAAWGSSGSDSFTISASDGSSGHVHGLPLTIGTIPIKLPD